MKEKDLKLPDFLIIGAQKCATSWLIAQLKQHPQIFVPMDGRELHFFNIDNNFKKGLGWYSAFFEGQRKEKIIGEKTPGYLFFKKCAKRINDSLPNVKLIICLRNPIDRAYSAYWQKQRNSTIQYNYSFEKFIKEDSDVIERGFYLDQINRYIQYFDKEQIHIILYDDLINREEVQKNIYRFLQVDDSFVTQDNLFGNNIGSHVNMPTHFMINLLKRIFKIDRSSLFLYGVLKLFSKKGYPPMKKDTREYLLEIYRRENYELAKFLKRDLSHWR